MKHTSGRTTTEWIDQHRLFEADKLLRNGTLTIKEIASQYTTTLLRGFGAATLLNGFILVLFLIAGEADLAFVIGIVVLTALAEFIRWRCGYGTQKGVRWSFLPFAYSFFAYTAHWWTDTEG